MLRQRGPQNILIPGVVEVIARFVPRNQIATSFRLVNRDTFGIFRSYVIIRLSESVHPEVFRRYWLAPGATRALSREQRKQLACLTAASGSIPTLEAALEAAALVPGPWLADAAAAAGQLETCQWLRQRGYPLNLWSAAAAAAHAGHQHVCEWLLGLSGEKSYQSNILNAGACAAAKGGHVALVEWLLGRWPLSDGPQYILPAVAEGCPLAALQRLHAKLLESQLLPEFIDVVAAAAASRTPDWAAKLEWLQGQGYWRSYRAAERAIHLPDALVRLQWLKQRGYDMRLQGLVGAARAGNVPALEFLVTELVGRRDLSEDWEDRMTAAIEGAAKGAHLAALRFLFGRGCFRRRHKLQSALSAAVAQGHVAVAEWCLGRLGCPASYLLDGYNDQFEPAASGRMEMLGWLAGQGVRWSRWSLAAAVRGGCSEEVVEWLLAHDCPLPDDGGPYIEAAANGDLALLRCLRRLGCAPGQHTREWPERVQDPPPAVRQWLQEQGWTAPWLQALLARHRDGQQ